MEEHHQLSSFGMQMVLLTSLDFGWEHTFSSVSKFSLTHTDCYEHVKISDLHQRQLP